MFPQLERYEIKDEIGHGGMATVYRARDTRLDRLVAVKVMHPHLRGADEAQARFAREARAVARLKHPAILEIYDYSDSDAEDAYIAAELLTGPTLRKFAEEQGELPPEIAACVGLQLALALAAAHDHGIVHRDVKPENVLLHEARCIKLTDFGIAGMLDPGVSAMTATGQILGSPQHMAPEQVESGDCDARTDLFALGTVLYWLATGALPFSGKNPHQVLKRVVDCSPIDPLQRRPAIGEHLAAIIRRCLRRDPAERFPDARALADALRDFLRSSGVDDPDTTLAQYLADPRAAAERLHTSTLARLLQNAEQAVEAGDRPQALQWLNRALAMDDGNQAALRLIERLGRASRARAALRAGLASAALITLAALVRAFWPASAAPVPRPTGSRAPSPALPATAHLSAPPTPPTSGGASEAPPPAGAPGASRPVDGAAEPPAAPRSTPQRGPQGEDSPVARPPRPRAPKRLNPRAPRTVLFRPTPMNVSISVDGAEPREFGPDFRAIKLPPGRHTFRFVGARECCVDKVVKLHLRPGRAPYVLAPRLKFRPASLYIASNVPADVRVGDGLARGRTRTVFQVPVERALVERRRISVTAPGYRAYTGYVQLRAGQMESKDVELQPLDATPSPAAP